MVMHQMDRHDAAYDDALMTEVNRPAAIVPEEAARIILVELSMNSVHAEGNWLAEPSRWSRYDRPWTGDGEAGAAGLVGIIQNAYGTPTKYQITIYRVMITRHGAELGWTIASLTDEALGFGGLSLDQCPRAAMNQPPKPFRF